MQKVLQITVAVGVVIDNAGRVLIARRRSDAHLGGLWEFPGGKVESGESVADALSRELREEVGLQICDSHFLMDIEHDYGDKRVCLCIRTITEWQGEAWGAEGQPLAWVLPAALHDYEFPEANRLIIDRLCQR